MSRPSQNRPGRKLPRRLFAPTSPLPCWDDYRDLLERLGTDRFPDPAGLNPLLPADLQSAGGAPIRFVAARLLPGVDYERCIYETGRVSTREDNWHDLLNALAWCRLPLIKAAMNALHYRHLADGGAGRRGPLRDALTLLDESGALVVSGNRELLDALARHDWRVAFLEFREAWGSDTRIVICGHALLEKLLNPYKSITAQVLLLHLARPDVALKSRAFIPWLDAAVGGRLGAGELFHSTVDLSALPLAGIPGWWPATDQDSDFYADRAVFRPPRSGFEPAPIQVMA